MTEPNHDVKAERGVLGSMLRDTMSIADIAPLVRAEDFWMDAHQRLYRQMLHLWERGKPVDLVTLADAMRTELEDIGGYVYLAELWDVVPTAAHGTYYARIVREQSILRSLQCAGAKIQDLAAHPNAPADEILEWAEKQVFDIASIGLKGSTIDLEQSVNACLDRLDRLHEKEFNSGILTGFIDLDKLTCGLQDGEMSILAARPSVGKTALALNIALNVIREGVPVFFASAEMGHLELSNRLLSAEARIDSYKIRGGYLDAEAREKLAGAVSRLRTMPLHIDDTPGQTVLRIAANTRRLQMRKGIKLVIVDYLQLLTPDDRRVSREQQIAGMSARLKNLARECKLPVLVLAQLNREVEHRSGRPRLADLRDSGSIEQDADTVLMLNRPADEHVVEVLVEKQRNGPTGEVTLLFLKQYCRFENYAVSYFAESRSSGNEYAEKASEHWTER